MGQGTEPNDKGSSSLVVQAAVDKFRASLTQSQRQNFNNCNSKSVNDAVKEVEDTLGGLRKNPRMYRVRRLIEGMSHLGKVVEIFLNVSDIIAFIWGPIKFVLVTASAFFEALDALLDTYSKVGEILPNLEDFEWKYSQHPGVLSVLEHYVCLVLQLHTQVLAVFGRPVWRVFFTTSWITFKSKFGPIIGDLQATRERLNEEKLTSAMTEIQSLRGEVKDSTQVVLQQLEKNGEETQSSRKAQAEEQRQYRLQCVLTKLGAPSVTEDQEVAVGERETSDSGNWLQKLPVFKAWLEPKDFCAPPTLFLNGIPGAGKTVLVSRIIQFLQRRKNRSGQRPSSLAYFYFKQSSPEKRTFKSMLAAILSQIVLSDDVVLCHVYQALSTHSPLEQPDLSILTELTMNALQCQYVCYVIIDGVDECGNPGQTRNKDAEQIISFFHTLLSAPRAPADEYSQGSLRVLFSGQRDGFWETQLATLPRIQPIGLDSEDGHNRDIRNFCSNMVDKILAVFRDSPKAMAAVKDTILIERKVEKKARGMFLFARVILENLMEQECEEDLLTELTDEIFPSELDQAYNRVAFRVLEKGRRREAAKQILGWICCAPRELLWREIQARRCIDTKAEACKPQNAHVRSCKQICGSLVDMFAARPSSFGGDQAVKLVHETAKDYLIRRGHVSLMTEHAEMAIFCARYLTSRAFKLGLPEQDQRSFALGGYYGFQDYAAAYWYDHVIALESAQWAGVPGGSRRKVLKKTSRILSEYAIDPSLKQMNPNKSSKENLQVILNLPKDAITRHSRFNFQTRIEPLRRLIKCLLTEDVGDEESRILQQFYGPFRFKCPKPWCEWFHTGFTEEHHLRQHLDEHERPFKCSDEHCLGNQISFSDQADLQRHTDNFHATEDLQDTMPLVSRKQLPPLWKAASDGDLATVKLLVANGADPNLTSTPYGGKNALILAISNHRYKVCEYLLNNGADVNFGTGKTGSYAWTPLHAAVDANDVDIVRLLLSSSRVNRNLVLTRRHFSRAAYDYSAVGPGKSRPVDLAAFLGQTDILKLLVSRDNANESCGAGLLPLHFACIGGENLACVSVLLSYAKNVDERDDIGRTPLSYAVRHRRGKYQTFKADLDITQALLESGANPNSIDNNQRSVVSYAVEVKDSPVIHLLIEANASNYLDKDQTGKSPLHYAVMAGNVDAVQLLINKGAADPKTLTEEDIGQLYCSALRTANASGILDILRSSEVRFSDLSDQNTGQIFITAADKGDLEVLGKLLQEGKPIRDSRDHYGKDVLAIAAAKGNMAMVEALLDAKDLDLNTQDKDGMSPIMHATRRGCAGIVRVLLERDVDVNTRDANGMSAILHATKQGNTLTIKYLLESGDVDVNAHDKQGMSAILYAAEAGNAQLIRSLLKSGDVDVNARDNDGKSSAMYAARYLDAGPMLALLERRNINVDMRDKAGKCALAYAAEKGSINVIQALLDHGNVDVDTLDAGGKPVLSYASKSGNAAVVRFLLDAGSTCHARKDNDGRCPLYYAALGGNVTILSMLLATKLVNSTVKDKQGRGLPYAAVESKSLDMLKCVLGMRLESWNEPDIYGWTILHHLVADIQKTSLPILDALLHCGEIDVNASTTGVDPRYCSVQVGSTAVMMPFARSYGYTALNYDVEARNKILETGRVNMEHMKDQPLFGGQVYRRLLGDTKRFGTLLWKSGYRPNISSLAVQVRYLAIEFLKQDGIDELLRELSHQECTGIFKTLNKATGFARVAGKTFLRNHLPVLLADEKKIVLHLFRREPTWITLEGELMQRVREKLSELEDEELWKVFEKAGLKRKPEQESP